MKYNTLVRTSPLDWFGDPESSDDYSYVIRMTHEHKVGIEFVDMDIDSPGPDYTIRLFGDAHSVLSCLLTLWDNGETIQERQQWAMEVITKGTDEVSFEAAHAPRGVRVDTEDAGLAIFDQD